MVVNNLKLIFSYFALNLKKEWKYKTSFYMQMIMMILNDAFFIIQWVIVFKLVDNIGGYGFEETMLLWAISSGGFGISHCFFYGAWKIKDMVYEGRLDVFLTQPKNAIVKQYQCLLNMDGVELKFEDEAIDLIAKEALKRKTGARALRSIVEEIMLDVMYEVPSRADIDKFTITADMVVKNNVVTINKKTKGEKASKAPKEEIA